MGTCHIWDLSHIYVQVAHGTGPMHKNNVDMKVTGLIPYGIWECLLRHGLLRGCCIYWCLPEIIEKASGNCFLVKGISKKVSISGCCSYCDIALVSFGSWKSNLSISKLDVTLH